MAKSNKKNVELPGELVKRKFQKINLGSQQCFLSYNNRVQSNCCIAGTLRYSHGDKEVGVSALLSAINAINMPQDPIGEPLCQFPWLNIQECRESKVRPSSGWILWLKNVSHSRRIMKVLLQSSCSTFLI